MKNEKKKERKLNFLLPMNIATRMKQLSWFNAVGISFFLLFVVVFFLNQYETFQ